jgi:ketosteroid isomerase-like protein
LPTPGPATPTSAVIAASRQWLDAYQRQDRATMASLSVADLQLVDERRSEERFAANVDVSRSIDRVSVQIAADTAVLTAVMTERAADSGSPPRVSPISQVWVLAGNQWRVRQVRLVSEARLNQIFR